MGWGERIEANGLSMFDREVLRDALTCYIDRGATWLREGQLRKLDALPSRNESIAAHLRRAEEMLKEL